jgi:hypothetical protein
MAGISGLTGGLAPRSLPPLSEPRLGVAGASASANPAAAQEDSAVFSDAALQAAGEAEAGKSPEKAGQLDEKQQQEVQRLKERDREVRQHEQAHVAAAGRYAQGGPQYEFTRGPDGRQYATGGEVSIDTSPASTPEATITKMQQVRRAALSPAEPSPQDRRVASEASAAEISARQELSQQRIEETEGAGASGAAPESAEDASPSAAPEPSGTNTAPTEPTGNTLTRIIASFTGGASPIPQLDARA